jgi:RimJ/RimL family protein N-acetyltransferase
MSGVMGVVGVELRNIGLEDLWLYEAIHCDSRMMEHLGGPLPREGLAEKLRRDVASTEVDEAWVLKIIPDEDAGAAAGTVSVWDKELDGETVTEIGWMVLPEFQGRGMGSEAVRATLSRIRSGRRWRVIHAFPPVANLASNAMCRTLGFSKTDERDFGFRDRTLRCNHWVLDVEGP